MKRLKWQSLALATMITTSAFSITAHADSESYKVRSGDSLWRIAINHEVSVEQLKKWNKLTSNTIYPGQVLKVSETTVTNSQITTSYTVKSGDTLYRLAIANGTTVQEIKKLNGLTSDLLKIGQVLKMPNSQTEAPKVAPTVSATKYATIHVVKSGEYLSVIAKKYNITVTEIKKLNGLTSDLIFPGQELKVTAGETPKPQAPSFLAEGFFPLPKGSYTPFGDTWGNSRQYGGDRTHEGTDIMAPIGTPIYSATDGKVVNYGWNELGGWRISVKTAEGYNIYYAHMSKYASGMANGVTVKKGQLIGYVGNTGYGTTGTSGKFASHLHLGIYNSKWEAINSYPNLRYWEAN